VLRLVCYYLMGVKNHGLAHYGLEPFNWYIAISSGTNVMSPGYS